MLLCSFKQNASSLHNECSPVNTIRAHEGQKRGACVRPFKAPLPFYASAQQIQYSYNMTYSTLQYLQITCFMYLVPHRSAAVLKRFATTRTLSAATQSQTLCERGFVKHLPASCLRQSLVREDSIRNAYGCMKKIGRSYVFTRYGALVRCSTDSIASRLDEIGWPQPPYTTR